MRLTEQQGKSLYANELLAKVVSGSEYFTTDPNASLTPLGYQQVTGLGTMKQLAVPANARLALIQAEVTAVRYRDDGTSPTATVGMLLSAGDNVLYNGDLSALRFIEQAAGAVLNVLYYA